MAVACSRAGDGGLARELTFRALVGRAGCAVAPIAAAVMDPRLILDPVMDPVMGSVMGSVVGLVRGSGMGLFMVSFRSWFRSCLCS